MLHHFRQLCPNPHLSLAQIPLSFESNQGQAANEVKFLARGTGYSMFLTPNGLTLSLHDSDERRMGSPNRVPANPEPAVPPPGRSAIQSTLVRMILLGANPNPSLGGDEELPGKSNYFIGSDPTKWHRNVPNYSKVRYKNVYPGIDLVYYGNHRQLEHDFVVRPGANPAVISLGFKGVSASTPMRINQQGDLILHVGGGDLTLQRPILYQEQKTARRVVAGKYVIRIDSGERDVGFDVGAYDRHLPLVIDPVLLYSTYLGRGGMDVSSTIVVDSSGNAYLPGTTDSANFPTFPNPGSLQPTYGGGTTDAFLVKLNVSGSAVVYSTYLGGSSDDGGRGIAVDSSGNAYLTGYTKSANFPTVNAVQSTSGGSNDAFVAKVSPSGSSLMYSTYLGGNGDDYANVIGLDAAGSAYVAGYTTSQNFPTINALQPANNGAAGSYDAFLSKVSASGGVLVYSTYFGGAGDDFASAISVDPSGNAYVAGQTNSANFPTANALQPAYGGGSNDAFVLKVAASGSVLIYSTYLGGSGEDLAYGIAVDSSGNAFVVGYTSSTDFPTANALQAAHAADSGSDDAFIAKLSANGTGLLYSTYLGGNGLDLARAVAVDNSGNAYVVGQTASTNFPTLNALQPSHAPDSGSSDAFVTTINANGSALTQSTYLGGSGDDHALGIAIDSSGNAYVVGYTGSRDFPMLNALQPAYGGGAADAFLAVIGPAATTTSLSSSANPSLFSGNVTLTASVSSSAGTPTGMVTFTDGSTVLGAANLMAGVATFNSNKLTGGAHSVSGVYGGDTNYRGSTSPAIIQTVNLATSSIALTSDSNPSAFGQKITFTAAVTSNAGTPTGSVTFKDGASTVGNPVALDVAGKASLSISTLSAGNHSITAVYSGDLNFNGSTSAAVGQSINKTGFGVSLVSTPNPSTYGQQVNFTATVTGAGGTPTGTITFSEGVTTLGTAPLVNGAASLSLSNLSANTHPVIASYSGDQNFTADSSPVLSQVVSKAFSKTDLATSAQPSVYGQSVTLTATITSGGGTPTGTVTFKDGATILGSGGVNNGTATLSISNLGAGAHSITASYGGDSGFGASASVGLSQVVGQASSSTALSSSNTPSNFGQGVSFTAAVTGSGGTPTGTVAFNDGSIALGTATITNGIAAFSSSALPGGTHTITAVYSGDGNFIGSSSTAVSQVVTGASTATTLSSSVNPSSFGQSVTFTAAVSSTAGTPTGSINFSEGSSALGIVALSKGTASFSLSTLAVGTHVITAVYSGDSNFAGSLSTSVGQIVSGSPTTTSLASSANPSTFGQQITFSATVVDSGGTPSGSVTFQDGSIALGTAALTNGVATLTLSNLSVNTHSISAIYSGDPSFTPSTSVALNQVVGQASSSTALTVSANPSSFGDKVTLTATVASPGGTPTGSVTFNDASVSLGTGALDANGKATIALSNLSAGTHSLTAVYGGDVNFTGSTSVLLIQTVNIASTASVLITSANPTVLGQAITFTAAVTSSGGNPTGTASFTDGTTVLRTVTLANGQAAFTTGSLGVGLHNVTAVYSGDANFAGSTSAVVAEVVNTAVASQTMLTSSANPGLAGKLLTFTALVSSPAGTPSGKVAFSDGSTVLGSGVLSAAPAGGGAIATFSTSALAVGSHSISAVYSGSGIYASSSSTTLTQVVQQAPLHTFTALDLPTGQPGWQMVASPFMVPGTLTDLLQNYTMFTYAWQPQLKNGQGDYAVTGTAPADTFHIGQGYWAYVTQDTPVMGPGTPADVSKQFPIQLQVGWNQVGNPFAAATTIGQMAVVHADGTTDSLSHEIAAVNFSPLYPYDPTVNNYKVLAADTDVLQPWQAGWLYSFNPVTLVIAPPNIDHLEISADSTSLNTGQSLQLTATAKDAQENTIELPASNFQWKSGDSSKATVDASDGIVTGLSPGQVTITVTELGSGKSASTTLIVVSRLASINLTPAAPSLKVGAILQLGVAGADAAGNNFTLNPVNLQWTTDRPGVATVDNNGNVTATGAGNATITVTHTSTGIQGTALVIVTP